MCYFISEKFRCQNIARISINELKLPDAANYQAGRKVQRMNLWRSTVARSATPPLAPTGRPSVDLFTLFQAQAAVHRQRLATTSRS
jgi:hypothetical protein